MVYSGVQLSDNIVYYWKSVYQFSVQREVLYQNYSSLLRKHFSKYRLVAFVMKCGIRPRVFDCPD